MDGYRPSAKGGYGSRNKLIQPIPAERRHFFPSSSSSFSYFLFVDGGRKRYNQTHIERLDDDDDDDDDCSYSNSSTMTAVFLCVWVCGSARDLYIVFGWKILQNFIPWKEVGSLHILTKYLFHLLTLLFSYININTYAW